MKRFLAFFLIMAVAAVSVFASGQTQESAASASGGFADYSRGFTQRVTIQVPIYDRAYQGWNPADNYWTRWIQREFGDRYNITVQYVAIGRNTENQEIPQLLAANRAPTIIFHYDMPRMVNYYSEGVLQKLNHNEIRNYAPTFWAKSGSIIEKYGTINGDRVFFFAERPAADNFTTLIRKDWVERAGYTVEQLTNINVYNQMLLKWKELGLGTLGHQLLQNNFTFNYGFRQWPVNQSERLLYSELNVADLPWAPTKEFLRDLNWKYNNGVLDPEFYLRDTDAKALAEFVAGRTGTFALYMTNNRHVDVMQATIANSPGAQFAVLPPTAAIPQGYMPQGRGYWDFGMVMGINHRATNEQRVAMWMFLEWMSQPNVLNTLQNGHAGVNFNYLPNGLPQRIDGYTGEATLSPNGNKDYWCWVVEAARYMDPALFWTAQKNLWSPPGYEALVDDIIRYYQQTTQYRTPDPLFTVPVQSINEYQADLNVLFQQLYVRIVRAPVAQFETEYNTAVRTYLNAGYQSILDEKARLIRAGSYN